MPRTKGGKTKTRRSAGRRTSTREGGGAGGRSRTEGTGDVRWVPRVLVKFDEQMRVPYEAGAERHLPRAQADAWSRIAEEFPGLSLKPLFTSVPAERLRALSRPSAEASADRGDAEETPDLTSWFAIDCPTRTDPERLAKALAALPRVATAYVEGGPTPPPTVNPADDPRFPSQGYLSAAPAGIDAQYAWGVAGGDGIGIGFVDLERGWTLQHQDLAAANVTLISGVNNDFHGHGTAVLGEVVSVDNQRGGVGIAPRATARVVSQWRTATTYSTADAIASATSAMASGDVLLLEAQTRAPGGTALVPVEIEQAVYDAIRVATANGIVVVEAAGNGSVDLDLFQDASNRRILDRSSADFRDSRAIMVGAASAAAPHARLGFSNFGSRIDCYGWGEQIDTTGDGWQGTSATDYTSTFGGTSGASPIVAGAAIILQAVHAQLFGHRMSPTAVRSTLTVSGTSIPSANPAVDRIGVMPNLRAQIEAMQLAGRVGRLKLLRQIIYILFGVTTDGGGIGIGPDGRPIPIGPWDPTKVTLTPAKVDLLAGLAVTELAAGLSDEASRAALERAGIGVMRSALQQISGARAPAALAAHGG
jgi:subtilisin family serine protease